MRNEGNFTPPNMYNYDVGENRMQRIVNCLRGVRATPHRFAIYQSNENREQNESMFRTNYK